VVTNFLNNNQYVKISLTALKVCTVQQNPNIIKFHEAKLTSVLEKNGMWYTNIRKVVHEHKDKKCLRNTNILNYLPRFDNFCIFVVKYQSFTKFSNRCSVSK